MTEQLNIETIEETQERIRNERRFKILPIPIEQIMNLLYPICDANIISKIKLPKDVFPVTAWYVPERREFNIMLKSEHFESVEPGCRIPEVDPTQYAVLKHQIIGFDENETPVL